MRWRDARHGRRQLKTEAAAQQLGSGVLSGTWPERPLMSEQGISSVCLSRERPVAQVRRTGYFRWVVGGVGAVLSKSGRPV